MNSKKASKGRRHRSGTAGIAGTGVGASALNGPDAATRRSRRPRTADRATLEVQLRNVVAQIGLDSARRIFASLEAAFDA